MNTTDIRTLSQQRFLDGYTCSEAVASVLALRLGLPEEGIRRAACAFCGGVGGMGLTCGALNGAIMAVGMMLAPDDPTDSAGRALLKEAVEQLVQDFEARHGATFCRDLLGCDISTPEGVAKAQEGNLFKTVCPVFVATATELLDELLEESGTLAPEPIGA